MLKITAIDNEQKLTLVLEGKLVDPWVAELERSWTEVQHANDRRGIVVDLKDVTVISQRGENVLFQMMSEGATLNCCRGVLTRHVLEQLKRRGKCREGQEQK
jgi:anti-anti-sigma regulatory factor